MAELPVRTVETVVYASSQWRGRWRLTRNSKLLCFKDNRRDAEEMLRGYFQSACANGKNAVLRLDIGCLQPRPRA